MNATPSPAEQSNGRERLLKAAIKLFGHDGFDGTSVRAVADEAGVSWGLVRFYFGSKDGLRDAAEKMVIAEYLQRFREANDVASPEEFDDFVESHVLEMSKDARFIRRAIMEERPVALEFLRELLATTESLLGQLRRGVPEDDLILDPMRSVVQRLGFMLLAPQFETLLGRDLFSIDEVKKRNYEQGRLLELAYRGGAAERARDG